MNYRLRQLFVPYRGVFARRDARLLFAGLTISSTGSWAYNAALIAMIYERTHSVQWVGAAGLARFLPSLIFSSYSGVVVERSERHLVKVLANVLATLFQVVLTIVALTSAPVILALACVALTATCGTFEKSAVGATIPDLVPEYDLVPANTLAVSVDNLTTIVGPLIGALILLISSPGVVFVVNAATFAVAALLDARIHHRNVKVDVRESGLLGPVRQMTVGLRAMAAARSARALVVVYALISCVYGTDSVLFTSVSVDRLGTGPDGVAYLLAGLGIGGILMAGFVDRLAARSQLAWLIIGGVAGYTLPTALLLVVRTPELAVAVQVVRGAAILVVNVLAVTELQRAVPKDLLGRVTGAFWTLIVGATAIGTVLAPILTQQLGLNLALVIMAVGPLLVASLALPSLIAIGRETAIASRRLAPRVLLLEQLGMFATARRALLERLAAHLVDRDYAAGTPIILQGGPADYLYVLVEGTVEVSSSGENGGTSRPIRTMSAPAYFGELGILAQMPRTATVTALTDCHCALISGAELLEAIIGVSASNTLLEGARSRLSTTHPSVVPGGEVAATA